jgi:hypothetical protein
MSSPLVRNIPGIERVSLAVRVDCRWAITVRHGQVMIFSCPESSGKIGKLLFPFCGRVILENIRLEGPKTALQFCLRSVGVGAELWIGHDVLSSVGGLVDGADGGDRSSPSCA